MPDFTNTSFGGNLHSFSILDTGISGTSQVTYKIQVAGYASRTFYVNIPDVNSVATMSATSTITAMEIAV